MNLMTFAIPGVILFIAALACWAVIDTKRGQWWLKLLLIVTVPTLSILSWRAIDSYLGWPTPEQLPEKVLLLSVDIREPVKEGDAGAIYVWVVSFEQGSDREHALGYKRSGREPRSHHLPYSRKKHKMLSEAMKLVRQGIPVVLERAKKKKRSRTSRSGQPMIQYEDEDMIFYRLPPASPVKGPR